MSVIILYFGQVYHTTINTTVLVQLGEWVNITVHLWVGDWVSTHHMYGWVRRVYECNTWKVVLTHSLTPYTYPSINPSIHAQWDQPIHPPIHTHNGIDLLTYLYTQRDQTTCSYTYSRINTPTHLYTYSGIVPPKHAQCYWHTFL